MKLKILFVTLIATCSASSFAVAADKGKNITWKPCQSELKEFCTSSTTDTEKHECLEEAPQEKISKACKEHNEKVEKDLGHKHEKGHSH